jgi:hypothetical protein
MYRTRESFYPTALIAQIRETFKHILPPSSGGRTYSDTDCLLSAFAMFHLKYPSLLQFDKDCRETHRRENIRRMYKVKDVPCDTTMRERLDVLSPHTLNRVLHGLIGVMQRTQVLQEWDVLQTKIISLDGTGFFSSPSVRCGNCCEKNGRDGTTYYHQMLVGAIVSPYKKEVLPVLYEPVCKEDGALKNDCERNAALRWLKNFRSLYPMMPVTVVEDGLASNGPHIRALREYRCRFVLGAKRDDHKFLYDWFESADAADRTELTHVSQRHRHTYRFMNGVPLNDTNFDLKVNVLQFEEEELPYLTQKGKPTTKRLRKRQWMWVTDHILTPDNVETIAKIGRSRWKIENETFNTLKNQGYHFEHNFGHGKRNLCNVLAGVMLAAFLFDQILFACNKQVRQAFETMHSCYRYLFEKLRRLFDEYHISSVEAMYEAVFKPPPVPSL